MAPEQEEQRRLGFLDLPPELRAQVYNLVYDSIDQQSISVMRERRNRLHRYTRPLLAKAGILPKNPDLALLLTCRTVNRELADIVFSNCHFGLWLSNAHGDRQWRHDEKRVLREVSTFKQTMGRHLQFVQHLEIGIQDVQPYIDSTSTVNETDFDTTPVGQLMALPRCGGNNSLQRTKDISILNMLLGQLASSMAGIHTMTLHESYSIDFLEAAAFTNGLKILFPKLKEVRLMEKVDRKLEITRYRTDNETAGGLTKCENEETGSSGQSE